MIRYLIELSIIHLVLISAYWVFLKNELQYSRLRYYLVGSTFLALVIPALRLPSIQSLFTPDSPVTTFVTQLEPMQYITVQAVPEASGFEILYWVYAFISVWFLIKIIMGLTYLIRLRLSSEKHSLLGIELRKVLNLPGSFSFFSWIFVNKKIEVEAEHLLPMVQHEHAHVRLGHSYDLLFFQLFRMVFWWLPSAWYINNEIKKIHEFQADAYALKSYSVDQYSSILISSTLKSHGLSLASSFHDGLILKRIKAMKQQMKRISTWKVSVLGVLTALLVLTFSCNEELDAEIKKMGESSNLISFDQLPDDMQNGLKDIQDKLTFMRVEVKDGEMQNAEEIKALDPSTIYSINVIKGEDSDKGEVYIALKKDGASFDYLVEKSKSDGEVFTIVEDQPQYPGGMDAFYQYVAQNITYPAEARKAGIEGKVYVQFVINKDGTVSDVKTVKGIGAACDEEAMRVISQSTNWIPGQQRGKDVAVRMVMPVIFKLDNGNDNKAASGSPITEVEGIAIRKSNPDEVNNQLEDMVVVGYAETVKDQFQVQADQQDGVWSGKVLDQDGNPLPGANIVVAGTSAGTVSDLDGTFKVKADDNSELVVSFVGYETVRVRKQ